jgi:hypothetical protein
VAGPMDQSPALSDDEGEGGVERVQVGVRVRPLTPHEKRLLVPDLIQTSELAGKSYHLLSPSRVHHWSCVLRSDS